MIDDLNRPNGIAISPDENKLYVADTGENINIYMSYDLIDGKVRIKNLFMILNLFFRWFRCDKDGIFGQVLVKQLNVLIKILELIGQIKIPELVSNCEFGGPGRKYLIYNCYN